MAKKILFDEFCSASFKFLEEAGTRHLVIGGLAVSVVGEPRTTGDADVIAYVDEECAKSLLSRAKKAGFDLNLKAEVRSLKDTGTFAIHRGPYHLDVLLASLPFEEEAYRRASTRKLFGRTLKFPTPEDLILLKVLAGDEKDMLDAVGVARRHRARLDLAYLERTLRPICDLAEDMAPWARLREVLKRGMAKE